MLYILIIKIFSFIIIFSLLLNLNIIYKKIIILLLLFFNTYFYLLLLILSLNILKVYNKNFCFFILIIIKAFLFGDFKIL